MAKSVLTNDQKTRVAQLASDGFSQSKIANFYGVSQGTISNALKEKRYEDEISRRDQMMQNAMKYAVESAIEKGDFPQRNNLIE